MFSLAWLAYQKFIIKLPEECISFHYAKAHQVCGCVSSFPSEAFDLPVLVKTSLRPVAELFSWGFPSPSCKKYNVLCFILHYISFAWIPWLLCFFLPHLGRLCTEEKYDKNNNNKKN